ncbi:DUF982 domain-containing protein [Mesorhizobium sp. CN2-181]|uniref:DUF982 domain-containing protein n=1 Tax=Mesorhizobium yinganensis TaxID=3157707 RepID=UPI0032B72F3C
MDDRLFQPAVYVECGPRLIQEISNIEDALDFLYDWPSDLRDVIHQTALRACQKAYEGGYPIEAARQAFVGFSKSASILADIASTLPDWTPPPQHV